MMPLILTTVQSCELLPPLSILILIRDYFKPERACIDSIVSFCEDTKASRVSIVGVTNQTLL